MKKTVQTVLLKKKKKFILMFTFAAILFLGFLCILPYTGTEAAKRKLPI